MVDILTFNIIDHCLNMTFRIRKSTIPFLPCKIFTKLMCFYLFTALCFYILNQGRYSLVWIQTYQNMYMIRHAINSNHFVIIILENAGYVLMQSAFPFIMNKCCTVFNRKNKLYMKLCIRISHKSIRK